MGDDEGEVRCGLEGGEREVGMVTRRPSLGSHGKEEVEDSAEVR